MKILLWIAAALIVTLACLELATKSASEPPAATSPKRAVAAAPVARATPRAAHIEAPAIAAPTAAREEPDVTIAGQRARLEDRFAAERTDTAWANTAQQELHVDLGRFATRDVGIRDVTCRASICRIELALATRDSGTAFMESWIRQRTWTGPGMADNEAVGADGQPRMVMFLGKDGQEL